MRFEANNLIPFTIDHVNNKDLVIKMLKKEEELIKSASGQERYKNIYNKPYISLTNEYAFNRKILSLFGFDTSDYSVNNYRSIFRTYYHSPTNYDHDVINSSHYMRNNRCVFYTSPSINVGDIIPNVELYEADGKTKTTIYDIVKKYNANETIIAAFSMS